jgi:ABC-2 type transport system ATP-binding protein
MQYSIEVTNVSKTYGSQKALDAVNLKISKGEVVGLLGPNGAGKSTLMKIITCFLPPSTGEIWVDGDSIFSDSLRIRSKIGYLPEHNPLYPEMYIREYLGFIAGIHKIKKKEERVKEMIALTGLEKEQHKRIGALSKGFRQRVGLAQALIHNPPVLILDEPTSGLDPNQLAEIRKLIQDIGTSRTVVLSTHIMQEVEAVCNRVVIIDKGRIVADAGTEALGHLMTGGQILEMELNPPIPTAAFREISAISQVSEKAPGIYTITVSGKEDIREALFNLAVAKQAKVLSLHKVESRMEDVFQSLTQKA